MNMETEARLSNVAEPRSFFERLMSAAKVYAICIFGSMFIAWIVMLFWQSPVAVWNNLGAIGKSVSVGLLIMLIWSAAVIIDRWLYFRAARKHLQQFVPLVAGEIDETKWDEAIEFWGRKQGHLTQVAMTLAREVSHDRNPDRGVSEEEIARTRYALDQARAIVHKRLKKSIRELETIGLIVPFVGLFGTVLGLLNAFEVIAHSTGRSGTDVMSEILVTSAFGLLVAVPAIITFKYFTEKIEAFDREMDDSSSELMDYFRRRGWRSK